MYTFAEGQSVQKMIKKLADIMTIIQVSPVSIVYPILSWTFINLCRQHYRARCRFEIFYDVDVESNHWYQWFLVWQTIGSDGFPMVFLLETMFFQWFWSGQPLVPMGFSMVFPLETMVFQWFWVWQTIGTNGFSMVFPLETMVFQWFPMVANHWSNDGMVTIHRYNISASINAKNKKK